MDKATEQQKLDQIHLHLELLTQRKLAAEQAAIRKRVQSFNLPELLASNVYSGLVRQLRDEAYNKILARVLELAEVASHDLFTQAEGVSSAECEKSAESAGSAGEPNAGTRASDPECRAVPDVGAAVGAAENDRSRAQIAEALENFIANYTNYESDFRVKAARKWLQGTDSVISLLFKLLG